MRGIEPEIIRYLETPPDALTLKRLLAQMNLTPQALLCTNVDPYTRLKLNSRFVDDDELVALMVTNPLLINRLIVVSPLGVKLCRPSETVLPLLPEMPKRAFF